MEKADKEQLMRVLEHCGSYRDCKDCEYDWLEDHGLLCTHEMAKNAYALLKELEAVEPYQHDAVWLCGNCEKEVVGWDDDIDGKEYRYPFCRQCGKAVKWNDKTY